MFNLIKSMVIILMITAFCLIPAFLGTILVDHFLEVSDTWKGNFCFVIWGFCMLWTGGFTLTAMAQGIR